MRSNELRIGNYVNTWRKKHNGIMSYELEFVCIDANELIDILYEGYEPEPIPLTEEWLVKFGFERAKKTFVDGAYAVTFSRNKDGGWAIYDTSIDEGTNYLTPNLGFCEHVHQLQNLYFALTSEELTIKE